MYNKIKAGNFRGLSIKSRGQKKIHFDKEEQTSCLGKREEQEDTVHESENLSYQQADEED